MSSNIPFWMFTTLLSIAYLESTTGKSYIKPNQCKASEYFDTLQFACVPCSTWGKIIYSISPNETEDFLESVPSDKTTCVCQKGFQLKFENGKFQCVRVSCEPGTSLFDGVCGVCDDSKECRCENGEALKQYMVRDDATNETVLHFQCSTCDLFSNDCVPCHWTYWAASGRDCSCPKSTHLVEDGMCIELQHTVSQDKLLRYSTVHYQSDQFISQYLYKTLRGSIFNCNNLQNQTACQFLINVCLLKFYTETLSNNILRSEWNLCQQLNDLNPKLETKIDPYYQREHQDAWFNEKYQSRDLLRLISVHFEQNGRWIGETSSNLQDYFLCENDTLKLNKLMFGVNLSKKCTWTATGLWDYATQQSRNKFYELYFMSNHSQLFNIMVKIDSGRNRWLVKRFFLVNSNIGVDNFQQMSPFVVYAKSVIFEIESNQESDDGRINPPVIKIHYETLEKNSLDLNHPITTELNVIYKIDDDNLKYKVHLTITVLCSLAMLWAIFRTWCWTKRNGPERFEMSIIGMFVLYTLSYVSNIFICVCLFVLVNQVMVFKFQSIIHTVLLCPTQESSLIIYLIIAYVLKLIQLFCHMMSLSSTDIFFIDWEKPRNKETMESYQKEHQSNKSTPVKNGSAVSSRSKQPETVSNVTIWRSYFVANEWSELIAHRRINLSIHIFMLIICLECTDWKYWTKYAPDTDSFLLKTISDDVPESTSARIALSTMFYLILVLIQYGYKKYIYENFGCNILNEFIDLCSVSNISVFCWRHNKFGYYLHGLSPNGRSDVNMLEMYQMLELEESDLCAKRGLLLNTEQQTFELCLPIALHEHWISLRRNLDNQRNRLPLIGHLNIDLRNIDKEKLVYTYFSINKFLISFIEHSFIKADYKVQDRTMLESLVDFELRTVRDKGIFYNDNGHSFENVLLIGIETTLITFELMTFLMIDLMSRNFIGSAIGTYLISKLLKDLFRKISRKNLVFKTLMDERFFI